MSLSSNVKGKLTRPTVFTQNERKKIVEGCTWADKVVIVPDYDVKPTILDDVGADVILHGDDIVYDENGESLYSPFERLGKFK